MSAHQSRTLGAGGLWIKQPWTPKSGGRLALTLALVTLCASANLLAAPSSGIDFSHFDRSVRIEDDLFSAVNGHWVQTTPIPADQSSYGAFNQLHDLSLERSRKLIEQATRSAQSGTEQRKIGDLYRSFTTATNGVRAIAPELRQISTLDSPTAVARYLGVQQALQTNLPLNFSVEPDPKNARATLLVISQGGLGLPDRDYYLLNDPRFRAARQAYLAYLQTLFNLTGIDQAPRRARAVLALETRLAQAQWSKVDNRDPQKTYNKMTREALQQLTPGIAWQAWFGAAGLDTVDTLDLNQPSYAQQLDQLLHTQVLADWRDYLRARLLYANAPFLGKPFAAADFAYHGQALSGVKSIRPLWKRGVALVEAAMGPALGKLYVAQYFPASAKQRMDQLVANLMTAYRKSITELSWMTPDTRTQALAKLDKIQVKIGYPKRWRDYSALTIETGDLIGNLRRVRVFKYNYEMAKLGRPVDRDEWQMTPQTVNAYYDPQLNEIVFPAAILQPPFFNPQADDAVNYGAIGAVIGHEISHGFDDQGSQYDGDGNLRNWWTVEDRARFDALSARLVAQYAAYQPLPGHHVNGQLTLGENIADNAGLAIAYKAYRLSLNGANAPIIDGLSGDQRFFIGFAQVWRSKMQDAQILQQLVTDPHAPARFRPNGAAVNADAFARVFNLQPGDRMYKPEGERIHFW